MTKRKKKNLTDEWAKDRNRQFTEEETQINDQ